ncbi:hypothetical protein BASA81_007606 [Batrachochytrium salamandrivorans]|nr:hypothetical protein BASA81_007606 [Batrachochytrium salamandrivorans]
MEQSDAALEGFDRLRVREVQPKYDQTAAAFLAEFQSTAASLEPDERIELMVYAYESSMELLKAVLSNPQANKICYLFWGYDGEEDVNSVVPLLINNCPELASLQVEFKHHFAFDLVSSVLEHPSNKVKVLHIPPKTKGDLPRFFAALGQSQVSALTLSTGDSPEFSQGLCEYLAKDLLVRLKVFYSKSVPSEMTASLANCTRLAKLEMLRCEFSQPTSFTLPKSITKLELAYCTFVGGVDWSFLADSNVRELDVLHVRGVDGNQLGSALAVHLRAKGLDELHFVNCHFVNETLIAAGVELGQIKMLEIYSNLSDASVKLIALALQSPNSEVGFVGEFVRRQSASVDGVVLLDGFVDGKARKILVLSQSAMKPEYFELTVDEALIATTNKELGPGRTGGQEANGHCGLRAINLAAQERLASLSLLLPIATAPSRPQQDMLSCFRGVRAARRDDRPSFGDESMPRAEALERFDRLRVREVRAEDEQTASAFLAQFQSAAASLEPDERIKLVAYALRTRTT